MGIIGIILLVLKIIGIILLSILGLILLVIALVLFVPIRYRISGQFADKLDLKIKVSYLLHIIGVDYRLNDGDGKLTVRLFGFALGKGKKKKASNSETLDEPEDETKNPVVSQETEDDVLPENKVPPEDGIPGEDIVSKENAKSGKKSKVKKRSSKKNRGSISPDSNGIIDKVKEISALIKENKGVVYYVLGMAAKAFRHILPNSHRIYLKLGLEDPALLGEILGAVAVFRSATNFNINVIPEWNDKCIEAKWDLKGRIRIGTLLWIAARVYFNKDVKKLLKKIKS